MNCTKCGKEIPEGKKKICEECEKKILAQMKEEEDKKAEKKTEEKNKKIDFSKISKNNIIIIGVVAIVVLVIILAIVFKDNISVTSGSESKTGNTIANIRNYGYTAEYKGWIYYVAPSEDGNKISIYKVKKDGSNLQTLQTKDWDVLGLNVIGDYIYFIGLDDEKVESSTTLEIAENAVDTLNNVIYRMKLDGSDLQAINSNEFHNNCYQIYVVKDRIYYIGVDSNIYYMDLDGSNKTKLNDDQTGCLGVSDKYIIFNANKKVENKDVEDSSATSEPAYETVVMDLDGNNRKTLTGEKMYNINIVGDYIYYDDAEKNIYKIKADGTGKVEISKDIKAYNMNIRNNYIYYMDYIDSKDSESDIGIFRMNLDGSDNKLIYELENYSTFLNTISNGVIFMDNSKDTSTINLINKNGEDRIVLYEMKNDAKDSDQDVEVEAEDNTESTEENVNQ